MDLLASIKLRLDPRHYQIATLAGLLVWGITGLAFEVPPARAIVILSSALLAQWALTRALQLPAYEPRSALISGLSLCLMLRTHSLVAAAAASAIAVGSKFTIRVRGKHVFNPSNLALVVMLATGLGWVSPGQWGSAALFGFLMACAGGVVLWRAQRSDITIAFLAAWAALLLARAAWLGQRPAVPLHQLENGALLLFAFFMISDPRATPDARAGRVLFAVLVALGAGFVQFVLYRSNGLLWSLAALSPLTPLIDRLIPAPRYTWDAASRRPGHASEGGAHVPPDTPVHAVPVPAAGVTRV